MSENEIAQLNLLALNHSEHFTVAKEPNSEQGET